MTVFFCLFNHYSQLRIAEKIPFNEQLGICSACEGVWECLCGTVMQAERARPGLCFYHALNE